MKQTHLVMIVADQLRYDVLGRGLPQTLIPSQHRA